MRTSFTRSWLPFPPKTREVQFDEKWAFVARKEKNCNPGNPDHDHCGDHWDHVAFDPEHRLVVSVVAGKRTAKNVEALVGEFKARTGGRMMSLIVSDEYPAYTGAILNAYGKQIIPPRTGRRGRPRSPYKVPADGLKYATVHKSRNKGRVVNIELRVVFGQEQEVKAAIEASTVSNAINTAFVERHNATDRNRNARKVRKTYCFSKDWQIHEAVTYFTMYTYNFCWPVRTLRARGAHRRWLKRTAAMAAGLADHVWSLAEWLTFPAVQLE